MCTDEKSDATEDCLNNNDADGGSICLMPRCQLKGAKDYGDLRIHRDCLILAGPKAMTQFSMIWRCLELWVREGIHRQRKEMTLGRHSPLVLTLPASISQLKSVQRLTIQSSKLNLIPPEIAGMNNLEELDLRFNYHLHWLPYETVHVSSLRIVKVCTEDLYGNLQNHAAFPRLPQMNQYFQPDSCSVCRNDFPAGTAADGGGGSLQRWTTQRLGSTDIPLLLHACSEACLNAVPDAPEGYTSRPHLGGPNVVQLQVQTKCQHTSSSPLVHGPTVWVDEAELVVDAPKHQFSKDRSEGTSAIRSFKLFDDARNNDNGNDEINDTEAVDGWQCVQQPRKIKETATSTWIVLSKR